MRNITIIIDGKKCSGQQGETILQIAAKAGIEIPTLCYDPHVQAYGACGLCVVEAEGHPKLLRACSAKAVDGQIISTTSKRVVQARKIAMELLMSDHEGDCRGPCTLNCPAGTDCQGYVKKIAEGDYREAVRIIKEKIPLPASIGRICPHPCESACRRQYAEDAISIAYLKAFAADRDLEAEHPYQPKAAAPTGKSVGIIGGGPAGLTAAYYLALRGHQVTVIDAMPQMGGMLRYGIPAYRLPKNILDQEIAQLEAMGVTLQNHMKLGRDMTFEAFRRSYDAVVVAIGAWKSSGVGCEGEDLEGVFGGIDFLREVSLGKHPPIGKRVAVVGGGNTAMDACRSAVRLGAEKVYVIYRRTRSEMPAEAVEIEEAIEEGVVFKYLTNPAIILGENGHVQQVKLQVMALGEADESGRRKPIPVEGKFEILNVDSVIAAIGQKVEPAAVAGVELNHRGNIAADAHTYRTNLEGVFAIGDATNKGASIAIEAIGEAGRAAVVIDAYLHGAEAAYHAPYLSQRELDNTLKAEIAQKEKKARVKMPQRAPEERCHDFIEINLGLTEQMAQEEAKRCLECGCHEYSDCRLLHCANLCTIHPQRLAGEKHPDFKENKLVSIERNQGKCMTCCLCVRICDEAVGKGVLGLVGRGFTTVIRPEFRDQSIIEACSDCGRCVEVCPTGALRMLNIKC